jgi:hypothetical protein
MQKDWYMGMTLVIIISCLLIALTLSVFYFTVATLARDVDRCYKQINKLFHELRMKAEENCEKFEREQEQGQKRQWKNMLFNISIASFIIIFMCYNCC